MNYLFLQHCRDFAFLFLDSVQSANSYSLTMVEVHPVKSFSNNENAVFTTFPAKSKITQASMKETSSNNVRQLDSEICLSRLVIFKSIFGTTYLGKCFHNFPNKQFRFLLISALIGYDMLCMAGMLYLELYAFNNYVYKRLFQHSTNGLTLSIVFRSSGYCVLLEYFAIKLLTLTRGSTVINIISHMGRGISLNNANLSHYYLIYLVVITEAILHLGAFVLMFKPTTVDTSNLNHRLLCIYYSIEGVIYGTTKSCICSLHMYASILICHRISGKHDHIQRIVQRIDILNGLLQKIKQI